VKRRNARQWLLRFLFQCDFRSVDPRELVEEHHLEDPFVLEMLEGVKAHQAEVDELISQRAQGWTLDRLATVDRNILRLALYELLYTQTPGEVVINEAVELAKRFGTERSADFVNGILDRVWKHECAT